MIRILGNIALRTHKLRTAAEGYHTSIHSQTYLPIQRPRQALLHIQEHCAAQADAVFNQAHAAVKHG